MQALPHYLGQCPHPQQVVAFKQRQAFFPAQAGPRRHLVLLNAGAAVYVGGRAESLAAGVERATEAIDSGAARELLGRLIAATAAFSV